LALAIAWTAIAAVPGTALANGALPGSYGILLPTGRPHDVVLATNFGLIISEDEGASWLWTCEQPAIDLGFFYALGPRPNERYYAVSPTQGLAYSDDGSCSWRRSAGALADRIATDFFVDPTDGARVLAVAAGLDDDGGVTPQAVYESLDGGTTFDPTPLYTAPPEGVVVGIEIARSNPDIVYIAMFTTPSRHPKLLRSSDRGRTWMTRDIEEAAGPNDTRILTVDRDDPDVLYLRVIAAGVDRMLVTRDAGATFSTPIVAQGAVLSAFLRMASGTVLVGTLAMLPSGGMNGVAYRSTDGGMTFVPWELTPPPRLLGLAERGGVLYLAGKNFSDGWALATSHDEGVTIEPLSRYEDVRGIKPCASGACSGACDFVASQAVWTNDVCTGALLDGGADAGKPPTEPGGCGCGAASAPAWGGAAPGLMALALAVALSTRRRRRP
jgi:MYXO-CTERM domain-containing protein